VILFCILETGGFESSINLNKIESDYNNVGSVFAINRLGLVNKIEEIVKTKKLKKLEAFDNDPRIISLRQVCYHYYCINYYNYFCYRFYYYFYIS
jgi:hypothetical protein